MTEPTTAAGRALERGSWAGKPTLTDAILAIEAEAAAPLRDALREIADGTETEFSGRYGWINDAARRALDEVEG